MNEEEKAILKKIKSGEKLMENELYYASDKLGEHVCDIYGDSHRWQKEVTTIRRADDGMLFAVEWMEALTEHQESEYIQAYEVNGARKTAFRRESQTVYTPVLSNAILGRHFYTRPGKIVHSQQSEPLEIPESLTRFANAIMIHCSLETWEHYGITETEAQECFSLLKTLCSPLELNRLEGD